MSPGSGAESALLPLPEAFLWGCIGGFTAALVLFILPSLLGAQRRGTAANINRKNLGTVIGLMLVFSFVAGVGTLYIGNIVDVSMAVKVGVGVQGFIKGIFAGGRELLRPSGSRP